MCSECFSAAPEATWARIQADWRVLEPLTTAELTGVLAAAGASVKDIFHERAWLHTSVDQVTIKAVLETLGPEHNAAIMRSLADSFPAAVDTMRLEGTWTEDGASNLSGRAAAVG